MHLAKVYTLFSLIASSMLFGEEAYSFYDKVESADYVFVGSIVEQTEERVLLQFFEGKKLIRSYSAIVVVAQIDFPVEKWELKQLPKVLQFKRIPEDQIFEVSDLGQSIPSRHMKLLLEPQFLKRKLKRQVFTIVESSLGYPVAVPVGIPNWEDNLIKEIYSSKEPLNESNVESQPSGPTSKGQTKAKEKGVKDTTKQANQ